MERRKKKISFLNGMLRNFLLLMLAHGLALPGHAQSSYRGALGDIRQAGYHRIMITPDITGKSNADLSDFRILSEDGKQVPYILKR